MNPIPMAKVRRQPTFSPRNSAPKQRDGQRQRLKDGGDIRERHVEKGGEKELGRCKPLIS